MKFYKKYKVELSDDAYNFAQYDIGSLREVLQDSAKIWHSYDDGDEYYTIDPEVVTFYEDLEDALTNFEELQEVLTDVHWDFLGDPEHRGSDWIPDHRVSEWIYDRLYFVFDDANEMIRRFTRWDDARKSFAEIIAMEAAEDQTYERLLDEFVRRIF